MCHLEGVNERHKTSFAAQAQGLAESRLEASWRVLSCLMWICMKAVPAKQSCGTSSLLHSEVYTHIAMPIHHLELSRQALAEHTKRLTGIFAGGDMLSLASISPQNRLVCAVSK
jgi:hypothetical protein